MSADERTYHYYWTKADNNSRINSRKTEKRKKLTWRVSIFRYFPPARYLARFEVLGIAFIQQKTEMRKRTAKISTINYAPRKFATGYAAHTCNLRRKTVATTMAHDHAIKIIYYLWSSNLFVTFNDHRISSIQGSIVDDRANEWILLQTEQWSTASWWFSKSSAPAIFKIRE